MNIIIFRFLDYFILVFFEMKFDIFFLGLEIILYGC